MTELRTRAIGEENGVHMLGMLGKEDIEVQTMILEHLECQFQVGVGLSNLQAYEV